MQKPFSPACERNKDVILDVLRDKFATRTKVLEIGSGTGQHAAHFARALPHLIWQTSDVPANLPGVRLWLDESRLNNTPKPLVFDINGAVPSGGFDAVFTANTLHIMSWDEVQKLFAALPAIFDPHAANDPRSVLTVYGPFKYRGEHTSASNAMFDASLKATEAHRGIRDFEAVDQLAGVAGLVLWEDHEMPANNRCITWRAG